MCNFYKRLCAMLACLLCIMLISGAVYASGGINTANPVFLTIDYSHKGTAVSGAAFDIYRIAEISEDMEYSPTEEFAGYSVTLRTESSEDRRNAAAAYAGYIARDQISPTDSGITDSAGIVSFPVSAGSLKTGLYLVIARSCSVGASTYSSEPFLISLPEPDENGEWTYSVTSKPKPDVSANPDAPGANPSPAPTDSPGGDRPSGNSPGGNSPASPSRPSTYGGGGSNQIYHPSPTSSSSVTGSDTPDTSGTPGTSGEPDNGTAEIKALKAWKDEGSEEQRPESIEVQMLCNGEIYDTVELNAENNWRYTWSGLNASYEWQVVEKTVPNGYTVAVDKEGITYMLINTRQDAGENPPNGESVLPPGGNDEGIPGSSGTVGTAGKLPQTGQLWWPVPILAAAGIFLLAFGWNILRNRRFGEETE